MKISPELWRQIDPLLTDALEIEDGARQAWLDNVEQTHPQLTPLLRKMLAAHDRAERSQELETVSGLAPAAPAANAFAAGARIGPFILVRLVGRGGMGEVWLANQADGRVERKVALKLPAIYQHSEVLRQRFRRERDILARLAHPNIARLFDAGVSEAEGSRAQPYLAMEYIEGESLTDFATARRLPVVERLKLFRQILAAVAHAHRHLVVHRDLKPANILIDQSGQVKLLDFGIAKLVDDEESAASAPDLTRLGGRVMTLRYAAPEQVAEGAASTVTDIYALGVILHELLTGLSPYRAVREGKLLTETALLSEDTSVPSSLALSDAAAAERELASAKLLSRKIAGDLDAIILKAMRRNPSARYASAGQFDEDIERHLGRRPVRAREGTWRYLAGRFVARHKLPIAAAAAVLVTLAAGVVMVERERRVAVREANKARAVQGFLTEQFEKNSRMQANAAKARSKTMREVLIEASDRVGESFGEAPELHAELSVVLSRLLFDVDEYERALKLSRDALALIRDSGLAGTDLHVEALIGLTNASRLLGNAKEALGARDEALAVLDARADHTSLLRARVSANSFQNLTRDPGREMQLTQEALALFEQRYPAHAERFFATHKLAVLYGFQGQWTQAERYFRTAIDLFPKVKSKDYFSLATAHTLAGYCVSRLGRSEDALRDFETGIPLLRENPGESSLVTRFQHVLYAATLHRAGRGADAHRVWDELRLSSDPAKPTNVDFDNAVYEVEALVREGRLSLAIERLNAQSAQHVEMGKRYYPNGVRWASLLALAHAMQGHTQEAETALKRIDDLPRNYPFVPQEMIDYKMDVTRILLSTGRLDDAAAALRFGKDPTAGEPADFAEDYVNANLRAAEIAVLQGDAVRARAHSQRALDHLAKRLTPGAMPWLRAEAAKVHGNVLLAAGDADAALQSLEAAIIAMRRLHDPASPWLADTLVSAALAHRSLGQREQAKALLAEARKIVRQNPSLSSSFTDRLRRAG
jgi:serine/threonine protein kinase